MRFLRRYNSNMLQLVASSPTAKRFWSLELWKSYRPRSTWECFGSLDVLDRELGGRHLILGFGTMLSLRWLENVMGRHTALWIGHRGLILHRNRSGI